MPRPPLPDFLVLGPFSAADAAEAGVSWRRLRQSDVAHPHRGVYAPVHGGDPTLHGSLTERCEWALAVLGPKRTFSHLTAARLWNIPLPFSAAADEPLHILSPAGVEAIRRPGVVGWQINGPAPRRDTVGLVPLAPAADVWCQLAVPGATGVSRATGRKQQLSREWLVAVGDFLLTGPWTPDGQRTPLCTRDDLAAALRRHRGKRGAKALAWALERVRAPVHSPRETMLRLVLMDAGLPEPEVQFAVETAQGTRHSDLGYRRARLLLEYHGDHHRSDTRQWREDLTRRQLFEDAGYRVIEVTAGDLADDGFALVQRIRRALAQRS